jgi:hypothetical protein
MTDKIQKLAKKFKRVLDEEQKKNKFDVELGPVIIEEEFELPGGTIVTKKKTSPPPK